jgi:hypothetical protein
MGGVWLGLNNEIFMDGLMVSVKTVLSKNEYKYFEKIH